MKRFFLLPMLTASNLLLASPVLAGGDGSAGGNSGFNPVGGSSLTSIGTSNFGATPSSQLIVPVVAYAEALAQALVAAGLNAATADGILALLQNQTVNGISPEQAAANLTSQLQAAGAGAAPAQALVDALAQLGSSPSLANVNLAVSAFNTIVTSADRPALQSLATAIIPIRAYLVTVIENVQIRS
jgi:hypothetical protein